MPKRPPVATEQWGTGDGGATHEASSAATPKQPLAATEQCGICDGGSKLAVMTAK